MGRHKVGSPFNNRRYLTILVAVAEFGSMTMAAEVLNTSQSFISRQIQLFEKALQTELFVRNNRGCTPTSIGSFVVDWARRILVEIDKAEREIREIREPRESLDGANPERNLPGPS